MNQLSVHPAKLWRERKDRYRFFGKEGKLVSFTRVVEGPEGFEKRPYWVGIIEFPGEGGQREERVAGQLVGVNGSLKKGIRVRGVLRRIGEAAQADLIQYGVKFEVVS